MSYSRNCIQGSFLGVIKWDTRILDYSSCNLPLAMGAYNRLYTNSNDMVLFMFLLVSSVVL